MDFSHWLTHEANDEVALKVDLPALERWFLRMFLRLALRCRWRKEHRTVTLDFGGDESCDFPDMRGSSVIFVNVHMIGQ